MTEIFEHDEPFYLSIGMTYEQYWYGDPWLVVSYHRAERMRLRRRNEMLWLQGMYFYEAICDASPLLHPNAKRGTKAIPYREKPYPLTDEQTAEEREEREEREGKNDRLRAELFFKNWAESTAKRFEKKE